MYFHSFNIHKRAWRVIVMLNIAFMYLFGSAFPVYAANDFVVTELHVDLPSVNQARDYIHTLWVGGIPTTGSSSDYTVAWISVNLANGGTDGDKFTQVGFLTSKIGVRWFVYSGAGVHQGTPAWGSLGCVGNYGDRATIGHWQNVELVTYGQGFWIARVYDQNGNAQDVAKVLYGSLTIYRATAVTEEAYTESTDPYILASFWHNHPKYMVWGTGFQDWPASSGGQNNHLYTSPSSICPNHYIARLNWFGNDPRIWYAGSAGPTPASCSANPIF
jgi:hypothetical protein